MIELSKRDRVIEMCDNVIELSKRDRVIEMCDRVIET